MALTQQAKVELRPEVRAALLKELRTYEQLKNLADDTKSDMETLKALIDQMRVDAGLETLSIAGFTAYRTTGKRTRTLNVKKLYAKGITPAELEECYDEKPAKDSVTIRCPGGKDE